MNPSPRRALILPVVHYQDPKQVRRNADRALDAGCDGVMLIHMDGLNGLLPPAARAVKRIARERIVGINMLGFDSHVVAGASQCLGLDATWTDEQPTHSTDAPWTSADRIATALRPSDRPHLVFVGVAFKHQRHEPQPGEAARRAVAMGFVPTTSGAATGVAADPARVAKLRDAVGPDAPLAIASGITPENAAAFLPHLTHVLVSTGVSSSFHEFDPARLADLVAVRDGSASA